MRQQQFHAFYGHYPYNNQIWLGYDYPASIAADAVFITHPHFDQDASYYFSKDTPVYRDPGNFQVGSINVREIATEHTDADSLRKRGGDVHNREH